MTTVYTQILYGFDDDQSGTETLTLVELSEVVKTIPGDCASSARLIIEVDRFGTSLFLDFDGPDNGPDRIANFTRELPDGADWAGKA